MSELNTNLNVSPYFDDYNEINDFYRILFRPRVPVQAREITQVQTILQKQIQRFADHVFKDGSVVDGCHITYLSDLTYVAVSNFFELDPLRGVDTITADYVLVGETSGVRAISLVSKKGFEALFPSTNRFYVKYVRTGTNGEKYFLSNEYIRVYSPTQSTLDTLNEANYIDRIKTLSSVDCIGSGYGVRVSDGIVYQKGFFSRVAGQIVLIREFDQEVNGYRLGFDTTEQIITEDQDPSLNDNALGYPNYNAPGAHRLRLIPKLVAKTRSEAAANKNFFTIVEFDGNKPTEQNTDPAYAALGGEIDRRTYEESGDYVVKPFSIETVPGVNANTNLEDANLFSYSVSTGIGYVKGHRVEKIGATDVAVERAFTEQTSEAQVVTMNYGNYVIVDEFLGQFDDNFPQVTLYDAAQNTITDFEPASGARAGAIVGFANLRSVQYYSGTKGTPSCQYIMYLDNIRMNSGKSFADVKSIYASGSHGAARADIVLSANRLANGFIVYKANLFDSNMRTMVFAIGPTAVKSLTDNSGATDTQFIFNDTTTATLQSNGYISVSLNAPGAGGPERINASGLLTTLGEKLKFDVVLKEAVETANLTGSVSINTTSQNVNGTGTNFSAHFQPGEFIRVTHQSGDEYRRVVTVANNTRMVLNDVFTVANSSATYGKIYPMGTHVDLSNTGATVAITGNTTFAINSNLGLGAALPGTANVAVTYQVQKYNSYPMGKVVHKGTFVKIDCATNSATTKGPWILGLPDVYAIEAVYVGTTYSTTNVDGKEWFTLDTGQRDGFYDAARLVVKPGYTSKITGSTKLLVKLSHFTANTSGGVGYFCVDSYPTSNVANSTTIHWAEIPRHTSTDGTVFDLRNCVDIRPYKGNTATIATDVGSATINPAATGASAFVSGTVSYTPQPDSNFQADVSYYLSRRDLVVVNRAGDFSVIKGEPDENPRTPRADNDVMIVANTYVPAWPSLTQRESVDYGRSDLKVKHTVVTNRRYTMKDIGTLDKRIQRLEYYVVLNAVEQKARDFTITDVNGLDRFKNGIFADPFNNHDLGKVSDFEYKISIDSRNSVARPFIDRHTVDLTYVDAESTTQKTGHSVTVPYTHEQYVVQRLASKFRNCCESVWAWNGKVNLYPAFCDNVDEKRVPNTNVTIDNASAWEDFANSPLGTKYGDWVTTKQTTTSNTSVTQTKNQITKTTTTTTKTDKEQIISQLHVDKNTEVHDLGTFVKDVTVEPYIESRLLAFIATNMKPNTVIHAFFDGVNVDAMCAPGDLDTSVSTVEAGREDKILKRVGNYGATIKSDTNGKVMGIFNIPAGKFRTGDRTFALCDVEDMATGDDGITTRADARFSASNMTVTTQGITLTTVEPQISVIQTKNTSTIVTTSTNQQITLIPKPEQPKPRPQPPQIGNQHDPIAQTIQIQAPDGVSGMFISKIDVYFKAKDPNLGVTLMLTEVKNGNPDTSRVLGRCHLTSAQVAVSADSSAATSFVLEDPVFVSTGEYYAFLVKPDGDSPEYRIWLGETGGYDLITGEQIYQNPYSGMAFVSANMNTWSPIQKEDLKFILYRASFSTGTYEAVVRNEPDEFISFSGLIRASTDSYIRPGDLAYTVNSANVAQVYTGANTVQPFGVVQWIDEPGEMVFLDTSTTGWQPGQVIQFHRPSAVGNTALINTSSRIATANISSIDDQQYHAVVPRFALLTPARTGVRITYQGVLDDNTADGKVWALQNDEETEFLDTTRIVKSRSNEVDDINGDSSVNYTLYLTTETPYLSPVLDLRRKSSLHIENLINGDDTNEANTRYGSAISKYVSRNVVLDDGQEAEDAVVIVAAYKPAGTNIKVYIKMHNAEDPQPFDDKAWTEMVATDGGETFSSPLNRKDFVDFQFGMPKSAPATNPRAAYLDADGIVTYTSSDGSVYSSYKTMSIKIVLLSDNPARVPLLNDVRFLALQV